MRSLLVIALTASALAVGAGSAGGAGSAACTLSGFKGAFSVVPGSAGAGNIVYRLRVVNNSGSACAFSRAPALLLLDRNGHALPSHATFPHPTSATLNIAAGKAAIAQARFSPDMPSGGEPQTGACEKRAFKLRIRTGPTNSVTIPVKPPTSVCGRGAMAFRAIHQGT